MPFDLIIPVRIPVFRHRDVRHVALAKATRPARALAVVVAVVVLI